MTFALIEPLDDVNDTGDLAAHHAELASAVALRIQLGAADQAEHGPQWRDENGEVICVDCEMRINPLRLSAMPQATRCVYCQSRHDGTAIDRSAV
ncbi:MAG: TraR/DksA C4-type zinc finger protein [Candidatus Methylumidiphilus sp.]